MWIVHLPATAAPAATRAGSAFAMFIALAILLGLFLLGVILTMCARRIRQRRTVKSKPLDDDAPESADPWTESARRLQPYPRQPKPPEA